MVSLNKKRPVVNRIPPPITITALVRDDGDAWQRVEHDRLDYPNRMGSARAGVFQIEIWQADPFFGCDDFGYLAQVEHVWAEFFLLRDLGELLGLVAELRGISK